jgi:hypothetical protein
MVDIFGRYKEIDKLTRNLKVKEIYKNIPEATIDGKLRKQSRNEFFYGYDLPFSFQSDKWSGIFETSIGYFNNHKFQRIDTKYIFEIFPNDEIERVLIELEYSPSGSTTADILGYLQTSSLPLMLSEYQNYNSAKYNLYMKRSFENFLKFYKDNLAGLEIEDDKDKKAVLPCL